MKIKIKIPFRMLGKEKGEIELEDNFDFEFNMDDEKKKIFFEDLGKKYGDYLGVFKDKLSFTLLGYERVPGIGMSFIVLKICEEDPVIHHRIMDLLREKREMDSDNALGEGC